MNSLKFPTVIQLPSCVWLRDLMDYSTPGFPVLHYLLEFAQTHVHWVNDAIQSSQPLSSPFPFNISQHQGLFRWLSSSYLVAKGKSFSFSTSLSIEYSGTLKSFLQQKFPVVFIFTLSLSTEPEYNHHDRKTSLIVTQFYRCVPTPVLLFSQTVGRRTVCMKVVDDWSHWEFYHVTWVKFAKW